MIPVSYSLVHLRFHTGFLEKSHSLSIYVGRGFPSVCISGGTTGLLENSRNNCLSLPPVLCKIVQVRIAKACQGFYGCSGR
jgi:hypothetical protein